MRSALSALLPLAAVVSTSGCFFYAHHHEPPPPTHGDISFDWSFDGVADCTAAGVREVDVVVADERGIPVFETTELCVGGGLTLRDFRAGDYIVLLDAYGPRDERLYTGDFDLFVVAGEDNYAGVVDLFPVSEAPAPAPPQPQGSIAFYWGFLYPTDASFVTACDLAGVTSVDVFVDPLFSGGFAYQDTFDCRDAGVLVENLVAGDYALQVLAYGIHAGRDVLLYDTGTLDLRVASGVTADLGDIELPRVDANFSDVEVAWTTSGGSCSQLGISQVHVAITRVGMTEPDDVFDADCNALRTLRTTFVPGSYVVTATALGATDDYLATTTIDAPPGFQAPANLTLVPTS